MATSIKPVTLLKPASEDREYAVDLSNTGELVGGLTITSATQSGGTGLTFGSWSVLATAFDGIAAGYGVKARISGGVAGTTYNFACLVTLSNSRVLVVPCRLIVVPDYGST